MGKKCKLVALMVVICMVTTLLPVVPVEDYEASEKVSSELLELLDVTYEDLSVGNYVDSGEKYSCIIWIQDVEVEEAVEAGIDAAEKTREDYSVWSRYDYPYTSYEADGLTYVEVEFDENETDEYVQTYIEAEREAAVELYSANNNSFVAENFMARDMSVTYVSKYSPCVFAELSVTKVVELMKLKMVKHIGCWRSNEYSNGNQNVEIDILIDEEIERNANTIRADEARAVYGVSGAGIKIGQIEESCPYNDNVVKNQNYYYTYEGSYMENHASNVHSIMSEVAPNAIYYATGVYTSEGEYEETAFYAQVEWLLSQGVNIINHSAGFSDELNSYGERERWVEHVAFNHDVHFVQLSGNSGSNGVWSPGMAYNIIAVGNTDYEAPYVIETSSSYNNGTGNTLLAYKPDIVAPGTYDYGASTGTSYSTPLVTGVIALMCEMRPALKTQQHIVKAILAATTSKTIRKYVTSDVEFINYGAGMLDARSALYAIYMFDFSTSTGALTYVGESKTYTMNVTSSDTLMRVALAYANRIEYSDGDSHLDENLLNGYIGKLDLEVFDPNGNLVAACYSENLSRNANLKIVEFNPNGVYGNYTIKVTVVQRAVYSNNNTINFGVAWR